MPHIFPRRFLRTRDILSPKDFNDDLHPVADALAGRLDRTNFNAGALKSNLRPHPDSATPESSGPSVAAGAYFKVYSNSVESRYRFYRSGATLAFRSPPNFVYLNGTTFQDSTITGANPKAKSYVVPNHGAWGAVGNANLSDTQKLTFTTGRSKVWISAYAQYIWQGFYEEKPPWIPAGRKFKGLSEDIILPDAGESFVGANPATTFLRARAVLNSLGPSANYEYLNNETTVNTPAEVQSTGGGGAAELAFPLNEYSTAHERRQPHNNGYHHISKGGKPCLIQFAIRVDGKIIEETITGKHLPFEESAHGLSVTDSIRIKDDDEADSELTEIKGLLPGMASQYFQFGQRSIGGSSSYGDRGDSRPGQKLRSARAVGYGPEVMPVRLGAVVDVGPGEHTIELVVRRLQRKSGKFGPGDFVGVFSRRLLAFDLPIKPVRQESTEVSVAEYPGYDGGSVTLPKSPDIQSFKTETKITDGNVNRPRKILASQISDVNSQYIDDNVFSNHFLPSKVVYSHTETIKPGFSKNFLTGAFEAVPGSSSNGSQAIFPGFVNTAKINSTVTGPNNGWSDVTNPGTISTDTVDSSGWFMLQEPPGLDSENQLRIVPSETVIRPNEKVILMMDVELMGIEPLYSAEARRVLDAMKPTSEGGMEPSAGWQIRRLNAYYGSYILAERYLDLFALFAIGYKQDGSWKIASESVPALVNSFNWVNRSAAYHCSSSEVLPINYEALRNKDIWEADPRWGKIDGDIGVNSFYNQGYAAAEDIWPTDMSFFDELKPTSAKGNSPQCYGQGGRLFRSNLGVNIPIMQVISNDGTTDMTVSEFAGFTSSILPDNITTGYHDGFRRRGGWSEADATDATHDWASPVGGRQILQGLKVHYGNSKLSAFKIVE